MDDLALPLRALLAADAGVVAFVGDRIYPEFVPPKGATLPALTYFMVAQPLEHPSHDNPEGLPVQHFSIYCWALTYAAARELAQTVGLALRGFDDAVAFVSGGHDDAVTDTAERTYYSALDVEMRGRAAA
ncbi:MAG: hypothetical protein A3J75_06545 [Acidobacteria bacterium RBG_16_68_9]|nr:MAG: hypothetical protein A3J75_06545 [Acidobacteria bacterium RBG_16_68_9]